MFKPNYNKTELGLFLEKTINFQKVAISKTNKITPKQVWAKELIDKIIALLERETKEHNSKHPTNKITVRDLIYVLNIIIRRFFKLMGININLS